MKTTMLRTETVVTSTTAKYQYSTEFQTWATEHWHLCHYDGMDCTAYDTAEAAMADLARTARLWNWKPERVFLKKYEGTTLVVLKHRRKVRA